VHYLKSSLFAILLSLVFSTSLQAAAPISGAWLLEVNAPRGKSTPTLTILESTTGKFSASLAGPRGTFAIDTVQVDGNSFSFPFEMKTTLRTVELKYTGQIDQDTMTGMVATPRGDIPFTGQRQNSK